MATFKLKRINIPELEAALKTAFAERYTGLSTDNADVRIHITDETEDDTVTAETVYNAHVPSETDEEAAARKRGNRSSLKALLRNYKRSDIRTFSDLLPIIEALILLRLEE